MCQEFPEVSRDEFQLQGYYVLASVRSSKMSPDERRQTFMKLTINSLNDENAAKKL